MNIGVEADNLDDLTHQDIYAVYASRPNNTAYSGLPVMSTSNHYNAPSIHHLLSNEDEEGDSNDSFHESQGFSPINYTDDYKDFNDDYVDELKDEGSLISDSYNNDEQTYSRQTFEPQQHTVQPHDNNDEEPLYVNAKQYHRIIKRRQIRQRLEELNRISKERKPYLHESRHRHAKRRPRGAGGRFLTGKEVEELKNKTKESSDDQQSQ